MPGVTRGRVDVLLLVDLGVGGGAGEVHARRIDRGEVAAEEAAVAVVESRPGSSDVRPYWPRLVGFPSPIRP